MPFPSLDRYGHVFVLHDSCRAPALGSLGMSEAPNTHDDVFAMRGPSPVQKLDLLGSMHVFFSGTHDSRQ